MFIRAFGRIVALGSAMLLSAVIAAAQTTQVEGTVKVKAEDGSLKPAPGALIEIYRVDIKGKYEVKADKTGHYIRLGLPVQGTYIFLASGQGLQPTWVNGVRVSQVPVVDIICNAGDGSTLTLDQVQQQIKASTGAAGAPTGGAGGGKPSGPSAQDKAKAEAADKEYAAKVAENKALQDSFEQARTHYNAGVELMKAAPPNYSGALSEFEQASAVDPAKHSAMLMLSYRSFANLAEAHYQVGVDLFNQKKRPEAKPHFEAAVAAIRKAINNAGTEKVENNANINNDMVMYYNILAKNVALLVEHYAVADLVDDTVKSLDKAEALDATNKAKWEIQKANLYRSAGRTDEAVAAYKAVLATDPKNLDALYNLGLALLGSPEKEKIQESVNALAAFVDAAPSTDKRVPDAKNTIEAIRTQFKVEAEKPTTTRRGKKP